MQTIVRDDGVTLVHDAYNANPDSAAAALGSMPARRRIAVLGEMADLGAHAERAHHRLGILAARAGLDVLLTVGTRTALLIAEAADTGHGDLDIIAVPDTQGAHDVLLRILRPEDLVLFKASRAARLDDLVTALRDC
ncbi:glutamate ligase domain-containing protein [Nocardiopsis sp. NRRL B-16309]|uniref:glutamate ligase domain-containing protein n=1 Tax=Nocardiopsis sp. NRRL B-16309 TaxID=1519494 RepID=UPI0006ADD6FE|nr:cyanophycin synthetase [Nocardiopsis sp. NRRL B-16309]KOX13123.1 hypothetical protein ADL05_20110 [Nocardiopsis sp. NRRL B-16309]